MKFPKRFSKRARSLVMLIRNRQGQRSFDPAFYQAYKQKIWNVWSRVNLEGLAKKDPAVLTSTGKHLCSQGRHKFLALVKAEIQSDLEDYLHLRRMKKPASLPR